MHIARHQAFGLNIHTYTHTHTIQESQLGTYNPAVELGEGAVEGAVGALERASLDVVELRARAWNRYSDARVKKSGQGAL
jgi:hypothetical protein